MRFVWPLEYPGSSLRTVFRILSGLGARKGTFASNQETGRAGKEKHTSPLPDALPISLREGVGYPAPGTIS